MSPKTLLCAVCFCLSLWVISVTGGFFSLPVYLFNKHSKCSVIERVTMPSLFITELYFGSQTCLMSREGIDPNETVFFYYTRSYFDGNCPHFWYPNTTHSCFCTGLYCHEKRTTTDKLVVFSLSIAGLTFSTILTMCSCCCCVIEFCIRADEGLLGRRRLNKKIKNKKADVGMHSLLNSESSEDI